MAECFSDFFAPFVGQNAAGLFGFGHFFLLLSTLFLLFAGLFFSRRADERQVQSVTLAITLLAFLMELGKMAFSIAVLQTDHPNELLPLYFCSLLLYMGPLAARGARVGQVFLATGGLIGGAIYLLFPTTSLLRYRALHFIPFHGFLWHGLLVYLGVLTLWRGGYRPRKGDLLLAALPIGILCAAALLFNTVYNAFHISPAANLMFLSADFPGTPLSLLYHFLGKAYTPLMALGQMLLPYLLVRLGVCLAQRFQLHDRTVSRER